MRIAIPSDDEITIAGHTGRTLGFVIYDLDHGTAKRLEYRTNSYTPHAQGNCTSEGAGQGHQPQHQHNHSHDSLLGALDDCQVMIAHGMGPRLVMDLNARNIQVIFCDDQRVEEAVKKLASGVLVSTGKSGCNHC
jgi:predicted Fe-Mo cluster-binding NifX family protein